jgi:alpha-D-ribose 1-methylphosphonate 5-triphosphate synthase subunit PhnH
MNADTIEVPGFADPVGDAQTTFRAVLQAMSRPGSIMPAGTGLRPPAPLDRATAAVALTIVDQETTLFIGPPLRGAGAWLAFHTGAHIVEDSVRANFLLLSIWPDLAGLQAGTDEAPEDSATLILQVAALGAGPAYRLEGPGLAGPTTLRVIGLPAGFVAEWQHNHGLFPRGVDVVLCAGDQIAALPRSVSIGAA